MTTEKPPCKPCQIAAEFPQYRMFCPSCLYCGARLIQLLGKQPMPEHECIQRRRQALADWMAHGHSEEVIRELVRGPLAIAPLPTPPTKQGTK